MLQDDDQKLHKLTRFYMQILPNWRCVLQQGHTDLHTLELTWTLSTSKPRKPSGFLMRANQQIDQNDRLGQNAPARCPGTPFRTAGWAPQRRLPRSSVHSRSCHKATESVSCDDQTSSHLGTHLGRARTSSSSDQLGTFEGVRSVGANWPEEVWTSAWTIADQDGSLTIQPLSSLIPHWSFHPDMLQELREKHDECPSRVLSHAASGKEPREVSRFGPCLRD